jgi:hypothetical protein
MGSRKGRKRLLNMARTEAGRLSRSRKAVSQRAEPANAVGLEARRRHDPGFPLEYYKDPRMSSMLGKLSIAYDVDERAGIPEEKRSGITRDQMDAAERFADTRRRYYYALGAPGLPREPRAEEPKACERCGLMIPCEDCSADRRAAAIRAWRQVTAVLAQDGLWVQVVKDLVIYNMFNENDLHILRPALDALDAYYRKGQRA